MQKDVSPMLPTRKEFMRILWERANDEALAHHPSSLRCLEMYAKYNGWDKPESVDWNKDTEIVVQIGECEECKKAGRETRHERWERKKNYLPSGEDTSPS